MTLMSLAVVPHGMTMDVDIEVPPDGENVRHVSRSSDAVTCLSFE